MGQRAHGSPLLFWASSCFGRLALRFWATHSGVDEWAAGKNRRKHTSRASGSTGNTAFDDYRAETLRRLEDEQDEFKGFLDRLRRAKDKAELDEFLAQRRRGTGPEGNPQAA